MARRLSEREEFPGVSFAHGVVWPSYDFMLKRLQGAEDRIKSFLTTIVTLTVTAPVFARAVSTLAPDFRSWPFVLAVAVAFIALAVGCIGLAYGRFLFPDPSKVYDTRLDLDEWDLKKDQLWQAGQSYKDNRRLVNLKGHIASGMAASLIVEAALLLTWATALT